MMKRVYYVGKDSSTNLEHRSHKYIKKVMKNGKWIYYYKDDFGLTRSDGGTKKDLSDDKYYNREGKEVKYDYSQKNTNKLLSRTSTMKSRYGVSVTREVGTIERTVDRGSSFIKKKLDKPIKKAKAIAGSKWLKRKRQLQIEF